MQTLYLNSTGSRWIIPELMTFALYSNGVFQRLRKADYYEAFGNFATINFRVSGIRYSGFARDTETHADTQYPIIDLERCRKY